MTRSTSVLGWLGRNRRRHSALNQLARQLYDVCRNATDSFELAAQLESLGYNRYRVSHEFGLRTTFDLAEKLFALTPRRPRFLTPSYRVASPFWWHLTTSCALVLTFFLYAAAPLTPHYALYVWLFGWAMGGTFFFNRAPDADTKTKKRVFTLLMGIGFTGTVLLLYWLGAGPLETALGLLWWQLPASFWLGTFTSPHHLRHFIPLILAVFAFFIPPVAVCVLLFMSALLLFAPYLGWPKASTFSYVREHVQIFLLPTLLGLGQGLLLSSILRSAAYPVPGVLFIVFTVFATGYLELFFKCSVAAALWEAKSSEEFQAMVFRSLGFYVRILIIAMFLALLLLLNILLPLYSAAFLPFILLALAFSLGFLLLGFNDVFLPATSFMTASLLVLAGIPFTPVVIALTAVLGFGVVLYIAKVERYCADLL
jgi:hypothetical protein